MSHMKERIDLDHQRQQEDALPCSICGHPIAVEPSGWREGHNAEPVVKEGRCCAACNQTVVIPKRLARFKGECVKIEEKELRSVVEEIAYQWEWRQPEWVGDQLDLSEEYLAEVLKLVDPVKEER